MNKLNNQYVRAGLYIRLSREDKEYHEESESIINQRHLLTQYVEELKYELIDIYIDDGYSGTDFNRPEFKRLLHDIELKKINTVITKDMSRLGRDYIGTGELIEKYFPEHNIRYIAVTDNIDTFLDGYFNDLTPFKALMNDYYAKDISKKIRASLHAKQKEGKFVGSRAPFGYQIDPYNKNKLIIHPESSIIVKKIFALSLEGQSCYKIAQKLTHLKIKPPSKYYNFMWKNNITSFAWNTKTIKDILTNRVYIGDMIQNKRSKVSYKIKKVVKNPPENYVIVKQTHEPIIDYDTFMNVQKLLPKNVGRLDKKETHLLDGFLYCGDCGNRIGITSRRKKDNRCYTICNYYRAHMHEHLCTTHSNNYDDLESQILNYLKGQIISQIDKDLIINNVIKSMKNKPSEIAENIPKLEQEINKIKNNLDYIYIDKLNNNISENQYQRIKLIFNQELELKKEKIRDIKNNHKQNNITYEQIASLISNLFVNKNYARILFINLIKRIDIFKDKSINLILYSNKL